MPKLKDENAYIEEKEFVIRDSKKEGKKLISERLKILENRLDKVKKEIKYQKQRKETSSGEAKPFLIWRLTKLKIKSVSASNEIEFLKSISKFILVFDDFDLIKKRKKQFLEKQKKDFIAIIESVEDTEISPEIKSEKDILLKELNYTFGVRLGDIK